MTATLTTTRITTGNTETPALAPDPASGDVAAAFEALFDAHRITGRLVAELSERADRWADADPIVVRLITETATMVDGVDHGSGTRPPAAAAGPVPAIVRARELGVAQARLLTAADRVERDDPGLVDRLGRSLVRVRALTADLRDARG
jgi:hypothetical protein